MYEFIVSGMTCGSCVKIISNAVKSFDVEAEVNVDLKEQKVKVNSGKKISEIQTLIEEAGYKILEARK